MASIVVYDPADPDVAGRVTQYVASANTPDYDSEPNKLVNPDLSGVTGVPVAYWKHSAGSIVEMTQPEKDLVTRTGAFQFWESAPMQSTTLETWQNVMTRTAPRMLAGTYIMTWHWEMRIVATGGVDSKAQARFRIDSNTKGIHSTIETDWQIVSGWDRVANVADGAEPVFDIEIQRDPTTGGDDTVEIRKMKIGFELHG